MKKEQKSYCPQRTRNLGKSLGLFVLMSVLAFGFLSCGSSDDDGPGDRLRAKIRGRWVVRCVEVKERNNENSKIKTTYSFKSPQKWDNGTELTFYDDGTYDDSSSSGKHKWDAKDDNNLSLDGDTGYHYYEEGGNSGQIEYEDDEYIYVWCWQKDPTYNPDNGNKDEDEEEYENRVEHCVTCEFPHGIDPTLYIPVYPGPNPPVIENLDAYLMEPYQCVYCSDGYFSKNKILAEKDYIRFSNQDIKQNTLDYENNAFDTETDKLYDQERGSGAYITGKGNNFTVFFKSWAIISETNVQVQTLTLLSGTKTSNGIKNLYYMTMFLDKKNDFYNNYMEVGTYRIFRDKDGNSPLVAWRTRASDATGKDGENILPWQRYIAK